MVNIKNRGNSCQEMLNQKIISGKISNIVGLTYKLRKIHFSALFRIQLRWHVQHVNMNALNPLRLQDISISFPIYWTTWVMYHPIVHQMLTLGILYFDARKKRVNFYYQFLLLIQAHMLSFFLPYSILCFHFPFILSFFVVKMLLLCRILWNT